MSVSQTRTVFYAGTSMVGFGCRVWRTPKSKFHQPLSAVSVPISRSPVIFGPIQSRHLSNWPVGVGCLKRQLSIPVPFSGGNIHQTLYPRSLTLVLPSLHCTASSSTSVSMDTEFWVNYTPPEWARNLKNAPTKKLQLANLPTPIHRWHLPGVPEDIEVFIKRDDMTGSTLSGNKIRKLEFLLADAISQGCRHVITCGGLQSNHCRAVAVACAQLGLKAHLLLRSDLEDPEGIENNGNVLLDRLSGAKLYIVPRKSPYKTHLKPRMEALAEAIEKNSGEKSYLVPVGGSNAIGVWGYMSAFNELLEQNVSGRFDDIVFACGSGGTAEGLAFGNYLSGTNLRIHGIAVSDDKNYFDSFVNETLDFLGLDSVRCEDILEIIEGYKGLGYGLSRKEELDFVSEVARTTGIMTDPVYTGKAVYGLVKELQDNPSRFKGKRILFIHTGGVFGMYDGTLGDWLKSDTASKRRINHWSKESDPVPM